MCSVIAGFPPEVKGVSPPEVCAGGPAEPLPAGGVAGDERAAADGAGDGGDAGLVPVVAGEAQLSLGRDGHASTSAARNAAS